MNHLTVKRSVGANKRKHNQNIFGEGKFGNIRMWGLRGINPRYITEKLGRSTNKFNQWNYENWKKLGNTKGVWNTNRPNGPLAAYHVYNNRNGNGKPRGIMIVPRVPKVNNLGRKLSEIYFIITNTNRPRPSSNTQYGKALVNKFANNLRANGGSYILVNATNKARPFYNKMGFAQSTKSHYMYKVINQNKFNRR